MDQLAPISGIVALALSVIGAVLLLWIIARRIIRQRRAHRIQQVHPRPPIYAVGSPEYNAQIVQMIHTLNERFAPQGKHVPERSAIEIIHLVADQGEQESSQ